MFDKYLSLHLCEFPDGECGLSLGRRRQLPHELGQLRVQDSPLKYLREMINLNLR